MSEPAVTDRLHQALFSVQGIVDSLVGPLLFLILYRTAGLNAALIGAGGVALALLGWRALRGQRVSTAWYGVAGVAVAVALAKLMGSSDGFFLPKLAGSIAYGAACLGSVVIGRPLVGLAWAFFHRQPLAWGYRPDVRRIFSALTLLWAAGYAVRIVAYGVLIADDQDRTGSLAAASIALGLPLTAVLVAITILVIRRTLGPLAQPPLREPAPV